MYPVKLNIINVLCVVFMYNTKSLTDRVYQLIRGWFGRTTHRGTNHYDRVRVRRPLFEVSEAKWGLGHERTDKVSGRFVPRKRSETRGRVSTTVG